MERFEPRQLVIYFPIGTYVDTLGSLGLMIEWRFVNGLIEVLITETQSEQYMFDQLMKHYENKGFTFYKSMPDPESMAPQTILI